MPLPPLKYCTVERASRLLNCEIGDLIHWHEIGAIRLFINIKENIECVIPFNNTENIIDYLQHNWYWRNEYSEIVTVDEPYNNTLYEDDITLFGIPSFIKGLWSCINLSSYGCVSKLVPNDNMQVMGLLSYFDNVVAYVDNSENSHMNVNPITIIPEKLIITQMDIEKIKNYDENSKDSFFSQDNQLLKDKVDSDIGISTKERIQNPERILWQIYLKEHFPLLWNNSNSTTLTNELNFLASKHGFGEKIFNEKTVSGWISRYSLNKR